MPKPVRSTNGNDILVIHVLLILNTEVELIATYTAIAFLLQAFCRRVCVGILDNMLHLTPEITAVETE